jgi:hypothetical protein
MKTSIKQPSRQGIRSRFITVNYIHVRSNGDLVEITCERDILTVSCDISEFTHATTHTVDVTMRNGQPRQE